MAQRPEALVGLTDAELLKRVDRLLHNLEDTISRQGWLGLSVGPSIVALRIGVHEIERRWMRHQDELRERICRRRFGSLSDDELFARIVQAERELMSAMEVSGPPDTVSMTSDSWRCACLVASKRPELWQKLTKQGYCKGALGP